MNDEKYEYEERAAIYEYDAGMKRDEAEQKARDDARKGEQGELWQMKNIIGTRSQWRR